ncbi:MAG: hypothetical protein GX946_09590 [Oligosphaeraceae bacterium]|nr:hypothetical protein [Oligosphaeraceae bacterium]
MKHFVEDLLFGLAMLATLPFSAYEIRKDIHYYDPDFPRAGNSAYLDERRTLDLYYPTHRKDFSTVVVFHGAG